MSLAFEPAAILATQTRPRRTRSAYPAVDPAVYTQVSLALTFPLPNGLPAEPEVPRLALVQACEESTLPAADAWAAKFLQAVVEAVSNDRPIAQLARWTSSRVYADLNARRKRVAAQVSSRTVRVTRHQIATVHVCHLGPEIVEVCGRVVTGRRSRAVAARLEFISSRWTCTELVFG